MNNLSSADTIASASAVIALCALWISIWQAYLSRRHNILSVRPFIEFLVATTSDGGRFELKNGGLGPAIIENIEFQFESRTINPKSPRDYKQLLGSILEAPFVAPVDLDCYVPDTHSVIQHGESVVLLRVVCESHPDELKETLDKNISRLRVSIAYRCMYGKKYKIRNHSVVSLS